MAAAGPITFYLDERTLVRLPIIAHGGCSVILQTQSSNFNFGAAIPIDTPLVIKHIRYDKKEKSSKHLLHEFNILSLIGDHPNIISLLATCYDFHNSNLLTGLIFIKCDQSLDSYLQTNSKTNTFNLDETLSIIEQSALGVAFLHSNRIIHLDLKPSNLLLINGVVKICDFDLAENVGGVPEEKIGCGTIGYIAPEHTIVQYIKNFLPHLRTDIECDIYSLGIVIFELICNSGLDKSLMSLKARSILNEYVLKTTFDDILKTKFTNGKETAKTHSYEKYFFKLQHWSTMEKDAHRLNHNHFLVAISEKLPVVFYSDENVIKTLTKHPFLKEIFDFFMKCIALKPADRPKAEELAKQTKSTREILNTLLKAAPATVYSFSDIDKLMQVEPKSKQREQAMQRDEEIFQSAMTASQDLTNAPTFGS